MKPLPSLPGPDVGRDETEKRALLRDLVRFRVAPGHFPWRMLRNEEKLSLLQVRKRLEEKKYSKAMSPDIK